MMRQTITKTIFGRTTVRATCVAPVRCMSAGSNMHDNDPEEIQKAMKHGKQAKDSVHEHAPGWNEVLASVSEANVKADQHAGQIDVEQTIEFIKKKHDGTEEHVKETKRAGTSVDDPQVKSPSEPDEGHIIDQSEREELKGPLGRSQS